MSGGLITLGALDLGGWGSVASIIGLVLAVASAVFSFLAWRGIARVGQAVTIRARLPAVMGHLDKAVTRLGRAAGKEDRPAMFEIAGELDSHRRAMTNLLAKERYNTIRAEAERCRTGLSDLRMSRDGRQAVNRCREILPDLRGVVVTVGHEIEVLRLEVTGG